MKQNSITIIGKTSDGETFRPSDWHLRLACLGGTFDKSKRLQYNEHLMPTWIYCEGVAGLLVNQALEETDPILYTFIRDFVLDNDLRVMFTDDEETDECRKRDVGDTKDAPTAVYDS